MPFDIKQKIAEIISNKKISAKTHEINKLVDILLNENIKLKSDLSKNKIENDYDFIKFEK